MNKIEIPLSKTKLFLGTFASILFVVCGILFSTKPEMFISLFFRSLEIIRIAGIAAIIFFSATGIYGIKKLLERKIGLTVDDDGILDNSNASSVGLIKWNDIIEIKTEKVASTKFLLIYISNPDYYVERVNGFKKKLLQGNNKIYGTPLSITSNTLKCNFNDLENLLTKKLIENQENMPNR
ncbi:STM3941 family protein [Kaistella polysaccharea]|uniref:STM3941 family protein n=1 Tax=Kaistella polysaccharea TaxID=2878534 RepID=UPI001CF5C1CD|nr:STM3941 family protein [Kaistella polysaccharea]